MPLSPLHAVISATGAVFVEQFGWQMPAHFGTPLAEYQAAREHAALFDFSHHGKVVVSGQDAAAFLHNLSTNDVKGLKPGSGCEAFLATNKAKAVAFLRIWRSAADEFWLDPGPGMSERVFKHLDHFLISEQVEIADRTADFAQLHLAGPQVEAVAGKVRAAAPAVRMHGADWLIESDAASEVWRLLCEGGARPAGLEAWEILRVEAGVPVFGIDIDEDRFVVEVGRSNAISYTKGCYLGQEPIVMARDRGHANRLFRGLKITGAEPAPRGSKIYHQAQEAGLVTSSVVSPRLGPIALGYLRRGAWEPGTAVEVEAGDSRRPAVVSSLPFEGAG